METKTECLEHKELKSCDRCLQHCSRIFWSTSKADETKNRQETQEQQPGTSADYFLTAGQLLETGPSGKSVFSLSQQVAKAPSLVPKRRHHVLNQSWRAIQLIDNELESVRNILLPLMLQKIDSRQQGVLQGSSDEFKNAITQISKKYRDRRAEVNSNCFLQMENLRRQLKADVELEEKIATQKTNEALSKRLKEIDDKLKSLGCTGPDFSIPEPEVSSQTSNLCRIEFDNTYGTSMLPVPNRLAKSVKYAEKDELQNFILYSRISSRSDEPPTKKRFKIEQVAAEINGLIDVEDDDEEND